MFYKKIILYDSRIGVKVSLAGLLQLVNKGQKSEADWESINDILVRARQLSSGEHRRLANSVRRSLGKENWRKFLDQFLLVSDFWLYRETAALLADNICFIDHERLTKPIILRIDRYLRETEDLLNISVFHSRLAKQVYVRANGVEILTIIWRFWEDKAVKDVPPGLFNDLYICMHRSCPDSIFIKECASKVIRILGNTGPHKDMIVWRLRLLDWYMYNYTDIEWTKDNVQDLDTVVQIFQDILNFLKLIPEDQYLNYIDVLLEIRAIYKKIVLKEDRIFTKALKDTLNFCLDKTQKCLEKIPHYSRAARPN